MSTALCRLQVAVRLTFLLLTAAGFEVCTAAQDPVSHLQQVISANSLDQVGKTPFHIKIAYKLFNGNGDRLVDSGFLEEWWESSNTSLVTVTSSAAGIPDPVPLNDLLPLDLRERYLLRKLLESELHPVPILASSATSELRETPKTLDKLQLTCLNFPPKTPIANRAWPLSFCVDQQTAAVRTEYEGDDGAITHNSLGKFHGTFVPVELEISFLKHAAITGKVIGLEIYDPAKSSNKTLPSPGSLPNPQEGCTPGEALRKIGPTYPIAAKANHVSGTVLLHGVVSKQGSVKDVTAIASSSELLTQAAIDAYKQWTYRPCLVNGQPSEAETNIALHFNFGAPFSAGAPLQTTPH